MQKIRHTSAFVIMAHILMTVRSILALFCAVQLFFTTEHASCEMAFPEAHTHKMPPYIRACRPWFSTQDSYGIKSSSNKILPCARGH